MSTVSEEERSLRRRIVCNSMPSDATPDVLNAALALLENEFCDEPNLKYSELVKRLRESIDTSINLNSMLGKIMILRNKPAEEIGADPLLSGAVNPPLASTEASRKAPNQTSSPLTGRSKVFNTLFVAMAQRIAIRGEQYVTSLKSHMLSLVDKAALPQNCRPQVKDWAADGQTPRIVGTDEDLHRIINAIFVWSCEKFGPVEADKLLIEAIRITEQIPESFEYSPRKFL